MKGRTIVKGIAEGIALVSQEPISFYGGVDPDTGIVVEKGHALEGKELTGKILVFPQGKGSTVGSYVIYALKKNGKAPAAIVCRETETIVAVGAIIAEIPMVDKVDISGINSGDKLKVDGDQGEVIIL
ncbi:MAG: DUF126 domain-containing protein [archaeon]